MADESLLKNILILKSKALFKNTFLLINGIPERLCSDLSHSCVRSLPKRGTSLLERHAYPHFFLFFSYYLFPYSKACSQGDGKMKDGVYNPFLLPYSVRFFYILCIKIFSFIGIYLPFIFCLPTDSLFGYGGESLSSGRCAC